MKKNFMAWHRRIRKGVRLWRRTKTNSGEHGMCPFTIMTGLVRIAGKLRGDLRPESDGMGGENEQYPGLCGGDCSKKDCLCVECRAAF